MHGFEGRVTCHSHIIVEHARDVGHLAASARVGSDGDLDVGEGGHLRGGGHDVEEGLLPPPIAQFVKNQRDLPGVV